MRVLRIGLLAAALVALALACGSFGADGPDAPDANAKDGSAATTSSSSGTVIAEGGLLGDGGNTGDPGSGDSTPFELADGGGKGECFDFRDGHSHGWTQIGNPEPGPQGYTIVINQTGTRRGLAKTFRRAGGFTTSSVGVDMSFGVSEAFQDDEYADTLKLYYGKPPSFKGCAQSHFELTKEGAEIDVWSAAASEGNDHFEKNLSWTASEIPYGNSSDLLWLDSIWTSSGRHVVSGGGNTIMRQAKLATEPSDELTIEIGGERSGDDAPELTITLRQVCVVLH